MNTIILSAVFGVVLMLSGTFIDNKSSFKYIAGIALVILLALNIADSYGYAIFNIKTGNFLHFTKFGFLFNSICIASTLLYTILSGKDIENVGNHVAEYFALIFFVLCGVSIVTAYTNLLMLFIGIEIISIPLYILTGSDKRNLKSNEASLKYFLMGAFSTGIMLMGITLLYGTNGNFSVDRVSIEIQPLTYIEVLGLILIFVSLSFKVSAAPFHFWTPDVYEGAPTVFTSFMATIVKVAVFAAFIRMFETRYGNMGGQTDRLIGLVIILTLAFGNLTAVFQQSVKRMLAYSSIAQAGFMMFAVYAVNDAAKEGLLLYATSYCLATIAIFAVLVKMEDYSFEGFNGFAKSQPLLAGVLVVCLLSLAGIPLTSGFLAKYYMLAAAIKTGSVGVIVVLAILFAAVSVYYYFRVIQAMYFKEGEVAYPAVSGTFKFTLVLIAVLIIALGIYPTLLLQFLYF